MQEFYLALEKDLISNLIRFAKISDDLYRKPLRIWEATCHHDPCRFACAFDQFWKFFAELQSQSFLPKQCYISDSALLIIQQGLNARPYFIKACY